MRIAPSAVGLPHGRAPGIVVAAVRGRPDALPIAIRGTGHRAGNTKRALPDVELWEWRRRRLKRRDREARRTRLRRDVKCRVDDAERVKTIPAEKDAVNEREGFPNASCLLIGADTRSR